jgi:hypothetical protein
LPLAGEWRVPVAESLEMAAYVHRLTMAGIARSVFAILRKRPRFGGNFDATRCAPGRVFKFLSSLAENAAAKNRQNLLF